MLHPVVKPKLYRLYCGPTAIAATTGRPPMRILDIITQLRQAKGPPVRPIVGMPTEEVCNVLGYMGYATRVMLIRRVDNGPGRVTMRQFLKDHFPTVPTICIVGGKGRSHFVSVCDGDALCNQTNYKPVPIPMHPYYLASIRETIEVFKI